VFDVTGAGDSVIAAMALALAAGATLPEAAALANAAASVVVGTLGTAQATPLEVLQAVRLARKRRPGHLSAARSRTAATRGGSWRSASAHSSRKRS
jgi:bifunctional ADP-heptose synthase (sugar kinase/adenylyltransferase)